MKKLTLLLTLALFVMVSTMAADSYTSAVVNNEAIINITNPNSPILLRVVDGIEIRQGESKPVLNVTNNMNVNIEDIILEIGHSDLSFIMGANSIPPGGSAQVELKVDDHCAIGLLSNLPITLSTTFTGGQAHIKTTFNLVIKEGELALEVTDETLQALWNGDIAPADTEYYRRYRKTEGDSWGAWVQIEPDIKNYKHTPGEYQFEARLGNGVVSPVRSIVVTKPSKEEEEKARQKAKLDECFKHEVEGLPDSDNSNE